MKLCKKALSVKPCDSYYSIMTNCVEIRLWFLTDSTVRIRAGFDGDFAEESYNLVMIAWEDRMDDLLKPYKKQVEPAKTTLVDGEREAVIQGRLLKVVIEKEPFAINICDEDGTPIHKDIVKLGYREDSNHRRIHTNEVSPSDCFYGFGEKSGEWSKTQKYMTMSPAGCMGYDPKETDSLYKHIPFYIRLNRETRKAAGYFYHNTAECNFDMGRAKDNYWKMHSSYRADVRDTDLFFIAGLTVRQVVGQYTDLTGKSAMPPRAALGYLGPSTYYPELGENCDDAVLEFIDTTKEEDIPVDGFQLSSGYTQQETKDGLRRCVFTWNKKRFRDPKQSFVEMKERGITVSPNVKPGTLLAHPDIEKIKAKGILVKDSENGEDGVGIWWGGSNVSIDFTSPKARAEWKQMLKETVLKMGTSSVWNDNCEYDSLADKGCRCDFDRKGITIGQIKATMPNLTYHVTAEAIEETFERERPFIVCRSGHTGIQRYAQTWAGDNLTCWEALRYNIATILGMSLSGVANQGADIGNFYGPSPEAELFVRWVQNGTFQPRFPVHSVNTGNTVTEPWMYGNCTEHIREAMKLHYRMAPYYYSLMERAHETGLPIMEPMCSAFQQDVKCYDEGVDFMIDDSLLVADVVEKGAPVKSIYLPEGEIFYDFNTKERYEDGQMMEYPVTLGSIPMFARDGGIIPLALSQLNNLATEKETGIHLMCVPDKDNTFTLYEDDGCTREYENDIYLKTGIVMNAGVKTTLAFTHEGTYETAVEDMYVDMVHREKTSFGVLVDDQELPHFLHRKKFKVAEQGWYYSQTLKSVQIKYPNPKEDHELVVSPEVFDMIGM